MQVVRTKPQQRDSFDSGFDRDALALFCSVAPLLVGWRLVPERIRTDAQLH